MTDVLVGAIRLHCRVDGRNDAPALVLSNSVGTDLHLWDPQIGAFSSRFRVIRYDSRGHGRSDVPEGPYSIEELGADLVGLMDALEIERAHVCGMSLGGMVALWLAAERPDRVDRAVFASTAARIGTAELWDARARSVREGGMDAIVEGVMQRFLSAPYRERHPEVVRRLGASLAATPADGYIGSCLALRDGDLRPLVPAIRSPALIVAGGADVATPVSEAEWLHARIPGSELVILEEAAHLCNIEQPDRFAEAVLEFLAGRRPGDGGSR